MKKKISIIASILVLSSIFLSLGIATDPDELAQNHTGIQTSNGSLNFPEGTLINGDFTNYVILTQETTFFTTQGNQTFSTGTKIDCDHDPGEPDPCDLD